jgi:hypothetical protein
VALYQYLIEPAKFVNVSFVENTGLEGGAILLTDVNSFVMCTFVYIFLHVLTCLFFAHILRV